MHSSCGRREPPSIRPRALATDAIEEAGLSAPNRALLDYTAKLTREPAAITDADIEALRAQGFDDAQVWEATFTASVFNLVTRMADAFGIQPPPWMAAELGLEPNGPKRE
jgi:alkylhydroperoxidase family enzyme